MFTAPGPGHGRPPVRAPDFDVEREDHDPDEAPRHVLDEDPEEMEEGARRMAARFAPERPAPAVPRQAPPPPPRQPVQPAARGPAPPEPPRAPPREAPRAPPPAPAGSGLDPEDVETLRTTLVELLDLKRILDQAR